MFGNYTTAIGASFALIFITVLVLLVILVFEIAMFVDVIRNENISSDRRLLWIVGMILVHPLVAIAYYFTDRKAGR